MKMKRKMKMKNFLLLPEYQTLYWLTIS